MNRCNEILCARLILLIAMNVTLFATGVSAQSVQDIMNEALKNPVVRDAMRGRVPTSPGRAGNPEVKEVQQLLNKRGFNAGTPDGIAGAGTRRAVAEFQASIGRSQTGQITAEELAILRAETKPNSSPAPSEKKSLDAREMQSLLTDLGYDPGSIDGAWGRRSQAALEKFRQDENSVVVGQPSPEDIELLRATLMPGPIAAAEELEPDDGPQTPTLHALRVVDRSAAFSVAWTNAPDSFSVAIVPLWSESSQTGSISGSAPLRLSAPDQAGLYHVVMVGDDGGSILARLMLEVR